MSCGLGAIILVFMLVKHNVEKPVVETELLQADVKRLEAEEKTLRAAIADAMVVEQEVETQIDDLSKLIDDKKQALAQTKSQQNAAQKAKASLEQGIKTFKVPNPPDPISRPRVGEEEYLIGLKVEGRHIGILVDTSASMTDEKLIDIIRRKNTDNQQKQNGPKWQRTIGIVEWLVTRTPKASQLTVVGFGEKATTLTGAGAIYGGDGPALNRTLSAVRSLVPSGATNLQAGLAEMLKSKPTDVYLITDGLPTAGEGSYKSLNPFADCSALWGGSSKISGACRIRLFVQTINAVKLPGAKVNVILLPLEGDPVAADAYWRWASDTKGLLISPAAGWP